MANEKCFCHFMGYKVKDSTAQKLIEENKDNVFEKNNNSRLKFWIGTEDEYKSLTEKEDNCLYITTDDSNQTVVDRVNNFNKVLYEDETGVKLSSFNCDCSKHSVFAVTVGGKTFIGCKSPDGSIIVTGKYNTDSGMEYSHYLLLYPDYEKAGVVWVQHNETLLIESGETFIEDPSYITKIVGIM